MDLACGTLNELAMLMEHVDPQLHQHLSKRSTACMQPACLVQSIRCALLNPVISDCNHADTRQYTEHHGNGKQCSAAVSSRTEEQRCSAYVLAQLSAVTRPPSQSLFPAGPCLQHCGTAGAISNKRLDFFLCGSLHYSLAVWWQYLEVLPAVSALASITL